MTRFDHLEFQKTGKFDFVYGVAFKNGAEKRKILIFSKSVQGWLQERIWIFLGHRVGEQWS